MKYLMLGLITYIAVLLTIFFATDEAKAHYNPGTHNVKHAINYYWCGGNNVLCSNGQDAKEVSWCESKYKTDARNGQYRGIFQMGATERLIYGHGLDPWSQAKAAHAYWSDEGWQPWDYRCRP